MPAPSPEAPHDLSDFAEFLRLLRDGGFEITVIGDCAVGAYGRLVGLGIKTVDLDILIEEGSMDDLLAWAPSEGIRVVKRPQPRSIPAAFLDFGGKEINVLTRSTGLPEPEQVARLARIFELSDHEGLEVPVADPYDLLANKLAVRREKDRPHIEVLKRFLEAEILDTFVSGAHARARLTPARRYLSVLGRALLPEGLAERLLDAAREPVDYRFLAGRLEQGHLLDRLRESVAGDPELAEQVEAIVAGRS